MDLYGSVISRITFKHRQKFENYIEHLKARKKDFKTIDANTIIYDECTINFDPAIEEDAEFFFDD